MFFTKNKWMIDLVLSLAILFVGFEGGRIYESRTTQSVASVPSAAGGTYDAANCGSGRSADVGVETPWKELPVVTIPDEVVPAWSSRPEDAALVVDVYLDYQCPYSQEYLRTVFPKLVQMAESGELQLVIHDYPLQFHENAMPAAQAARCAAGMGKYQEYVMALIENSGASDVEGAAREIGLDWDRLSACMERQADVVSADFDAGAKAGITATPTTVINGRAIAGALPWDVFERLFEEAINGK